MIIKKISLLCIILLLINCKSTHLTKNISKQVNEDFYKNQFTGVFIYNPKTKDTIINYNGDKYFTPASNVKIFTLFTALNLLPKKIPALKYKTNKDTLVVLPTGAPTFLHSYFKDSTALKFLKKHAYIKIITNNLIDEKFGYGWAWEDYDTYFSPEKSSFPMYGNVLTAVNKDSLQCEPKVLSTSLSYKTNQKFRRNLNKNKFYYPIQKKDTIKIPFLLNTDLQKKLWNDLLPNKVSFTKEIPLKLETLFSIKSDDLYKRMMHVSDNFLAEQMLILASSTLSDTLDSKKVRKLILTNQLKNLKHKPRWVDGSGLSRYNLFTPSSFVYVLDKMYSEIERKRLFEFFSVVGKSGTLKNGFKGNNKPYIYAKSGSLSNNYNLSGYLITNSGKTLIFSFMNNHHRKSTKDIKTHMQKMFARLRDNY